tara:strand:- start:3684 stop:4256 length:573 start_codon:yes stop_codon:yes gene_type:complete
MGTLDEKGYILVENFLTKEEVSLLTEHTLLFHKNNFVDLEYNDFKQNNNCDTGVYSDTVMESLMVNKKSKMEEITKLKLQPTYTFWRMYTNGSELLKHKDRESCEVSVSVMLGSNYKPWYFHIGEDKYDLEPGNAIIYKGCEMFHFREPFRGDWHSQVFLHYVNQAGPNKDHAFDKRVRLGISNNINHGI